MRKYEGAARLRHAFLIALCFCAGSLLSQTFIPKRAQTGNGILVFNEAGKNVLATFYHELNEARTDCDVEDAIRAGDDPNAVKFLGWTSKQGEACGDFTAFESGNDLSNVFQEVPLIAGSGTVRVQFQYSDDAHGPEGPRATAAKKVKVKAA